MILYSAKKVPKLIYVADKCTDISGGQQTNLDLNSLIEVLDCTLTLKATANNNDLSRTGR